MIAITMISACYSWLDINQLQSVSISEIDINKWSGTKLKNHVTSSSFIIIIISNNGNTFDHHLTLNINYKPKTKIRAIESGVVYTVIRVKYDSCCYLRTISDSEPLSNSFLSCSWDSLTRVLSNHGQLSSVSTTIRT